MKKIVVLALAFLLQVSCQQKTDNQTVLPSATKAITPQEKLAQANKIKEEEAIRHQIIQLVQKKDSLQTSLKTTKESMSKINDAKIDKGINDVKTQLNELKGQKENLEEQVNLQKKEIELATQKIALYKQEKEIYIQHRTALFDRGAPPKDFAKIDDLLQINSTKLTNQNTKIKTLNRSVIDTEEQINSITEQRSFLSTKIRQNYNAQEIFEEYAIEEELKISTKIKDIDAQLLKLNGNKKDSVAIRTVILKTKENKPNKGTNKLTELPIDKEERANRLKTAGYAITGVLLIFGFFYFINKKKNNNN